MKIRKGPKKAFITTRWTDVKRLTVTAMSPDTTAVTNMRLDLSVEHPVFGVQKLMQKRTV